jgi:hypothetical protein
MTRPLLTRREAPPEDPGTNPQLTPPVIVAPPAAPPSWRRLRRIKMKWIIVMAMAVLVFRRAVAYAVIAGLSAALHIVGLNVHLPHLTFGWPWQSITSGTTTNADIGPWVLQNIEGITKPALGTENFNFMFTHEVSKNIGFWPCWYSASFYAVGHASATVNLNPGARWWEPDTGHYRLQVLTKPVGGQPGSVNVTLTLPVPELPQSIHDVTIDDSVSQPVSTQHSWTYPGFGCGVLIRPQFATQVLYQQAQSIAFQRVQHDPRISQPLITAAEQAAVKIIRDNFIQPTVNRFGYKLNRFALEWSGVS